MRALVSNKVMVILVDSGSSRSFVNTNFLNIVGIEAIPTEPKQVKLANGGTMITDKWVPKMEWWANGHTLSSDMKVLSLGAYEAILGYDRLKSHSPMWCDCEAKILEFEHAGIQIKLKGVQTMTKVVQGVTIDKVVKWAVGNDIWEVAMVDVLPQSPQQSSILEAQQLLEKFQDVFQKPTTLPPAKFYDHHIPLLPGSVLVNSWPYRYSPHHKDEI